MTLNVYSLYSTTLQYSSNVINSQPNLNLNFNSTQKDEEMELPTTAGKEVVVTAQPNLNITQLKVGVTL